MFQEVTQKLSWIRIESEAVTSREFLLIRRHTGLSPATVFGGLVTVWLYVDEHAWMEPEVLDSGRMTYTDADAVIEGMDVQTIKLAFDDQVASVVDGMVEAGWIVIDGNNIVFPNFGRRATKGLRRNREAWAKRAGRRGGLASTSENASESLSKNASESLSESSSESVSEKPSGQVDLRQTVETVETDNKEPTASAVVVHVADSGDQPAVVSIPCSQVVGYWNELTGQRVRVTAGRRSQLATRWRDAWWRENWAMAMRRCVASSFCMGGGDKGWKATLDWFLRPDSATKLMEGAYDETNTGHARGNGHSKAEQRDQRLAQALHDFVNDPEDEQTDEQGRVCGDDRDPLRIEASRRAHEAADDNLVASAVTVRHDDDPGSDIEADLPF